jgi:hypothetical protein
MSRMVFSFEIVYFVPKWKQHQTGYLFRIDAGGITRERVYNSMSELVQNGVVAIPIDPMTAIGMGLVTPEEINLPEGLRAAFNLLK